jgi:DNA polymerase
VWEWAKKNDRTLGLSNEVYVACEILKRAWRDAHPATTALWKAASESTRAAIKNPGETFNIGQHLKVSRDGTWLRLRLPSGRYLCYINPKVDDDGQISYFGVNQYTRQWGPIKTYGGKLVENATQAFARDILGHSMPIIEAAGYPIVLSVHDELLTETPDSDAFNVDDLSRMMSAAPSWAKGIPLAAAGFETYRYRKE